MILSDISIREQIDNGRIVIEPYEESNIQPSSLDLRIGSDFRVFRNSRYPYIDPRIEQPGLMAQITATEKEPFVLHPNEFALGTTYEYMELPDDILGRLEGKSTLGRLGLMIHSTAGYVDPGFKGFLTLELTNVANLPILLYPEMLIGQISFTLMTTPVEVPYGDPSLGSHYQGQVGATPSKPLS